MVWRISDRTTFEAVRRTSLRARRGLVSVAFVADAGTAPRVAYAVGRTVGNAVERNRIRRRLRAVVSDVARELAPGAFVVTATRGSAQLPYEELKAQVREAMRAAAGVRGT